MAVVDDLVERLGVELGSASVSAERSVQLIESACAAFEEATNRRVTPPADGDPETVVVEKITGGVVPIPSARTLSKVEVSQTAVNPTWVEVEGWDAESQFTGTVYEWVNLPPLVDGAVARVTGRFGMVPTPTTIVDALVAFAVHTERATGGEADLDVHYHDEGPAGPRQTDRMPAAWRAAVARYRVDAPTVRIPIF